MATGSPGTPISINGFQCWDEGAYEVFDVKNGAQAFRTILCNWGDRIALSKSLTGAPSIPGQPSAVPSPYPDYPDVKVSKVTSAMQPGSTGYFVGTNGLVACKYARLTIQFDPPNFPGISVDPPTLPSGLPSLIECDFECDVFTVPGGSMKFSNGHLSSAPFSKLIPTARLVIPRSALIDFDGTRLFRFLAGVNNADFYGSNTDHSMFLGAPTSQRYTAAGTFVWDRKFSFKVRGNDTTVPTFQQGWDVVAAAFVNYDPLPFSRMSFGTLLGP